MINIWGIICFLWTSGVFNVCAAQSSEEIGPIDVDAGKEAMKNLLNYINELSPLQNYDNLVAQIDQATSYDTLSIAAQSISASMSDDTLKQAEELGIILPIFLVPKMWSPPDALQVQGNTAESPKQIA